MTITQDIRNTHLPNLAIFGVAPTLVLYKYSTDFNDFMHQAEAFRTNDLLFAYYALPFFIPLIISWTHYWNWFVTPARRLFIQNACAAIKSIYYVVSGICLTGAVILVSNISNLRDTSIVIFGLMAGTFFFIGAVLVDFLLPDTLKPGYPHSARSIS